MNDKKISVLFLCTENSCRSQIAEALLRKHGGDRFDAFSAGLAPKPVHPLTIQVLQEAGIDIHSARSKDVKEFLGKVNLDFVVIVCGNAGKHCPHTWPGLRNAPLHWYFDDPAEGNGTPEEQIPKFRKVFDQIERKVQMLIEVLKTEPESIH